MAAPKSAIRGALTNTKSQPSTQTQTRPDLKREEEEKEEKDAIATTTTPYAQALSRLEPLQPILAGLTHRNRNQHRRATWWRAFGLLRRNCSKLVEDLIPAVAAAEKAARRNAKAKAKAELKAKSKKKRRGGDEDLDPALSALGGAETLEKEDRFLPASARTNDAKAVVARAIWLRDILVPKCYLAFSQLTADGQFAPLGVVLLGILAQVRAACDLAAPPPPPLPSPVSAFEGVATIAEPKGSRVERPLESPAAWGDSSLLIAPSLFMTVLEPGSGSGGKVATAPSEKEGAGVGIPSKERDIGAGQAISREDVERAVELRTKKKMNKKTMTLVKEEAETKRREVKVTNTVSPSTRLPQPQSPSSSSSRLEPKEPSTTAIKKSIPSKRREHPSPQPQGDELDALTSDRPVKKTKTATTTTTETNKIDERPKKKKEGINYSYQDDNDNKQSKEEKQKSNNNSSNSIHTKLQKKQQQEQQQQEKPKPKKKKKKGDEFDDLFKGLV